MSESTQLARIDVSPHLLIAIRRGMPIARFTYHHDNRYSLLILHNVDGHNRVLCLGQLYTAAEAHTLLPPVFSDGDLIERRGWYLRELDHRIAMASRGGDKDLASLLLQEQSMWELDDDEALAGRVYGEGRLSRLYDRDEHWTWEGKFTGQKPRVNFRGHINIPVTRLLWTRHRNHEIMLTRDMQPRSDRRVCTGLNAVMCCNPFHLGWEPKTKLAPNPAGPGRGRTPTIGSFRPTWTLDQVDDDGIIRCRFGHELSRADQDAAKARVLKRQGYCPTCYAWALAARGKVPRDETGYVQQQAMSSWIAATGIDFNAGIGNVPQLDSGAGEGVDFTLPPG